MLKKTPQTFKQFQVLSSKFQERKVRRQGEWYQRGSWESRAAAPAAEIPDQLESCGEPRSNQIRGRLRGGPSRN